MIEALLQAERLLVHGMVDQAEEIYANAVEQDPRNAIAMVGLARVALERSDDLKAYQHAVAALEIDPDNVAALRLEARLSEVMAARGEGASRPDTRPAELEPEARPSEAHVFDHNPTMTQHRESDERRRATPMPETTPRDEERFEPERRSLIRRLLGR